MLNIIRKDGSRPARIIFSMCYLLCISCSSIVGDKEKEYQFSSEIPPLEVPPNLTVSSIEDTTVQKTDVSQDPSDASLLRENIESKDISANSGQSRLVRGDNGSTYIEVHSDFAGVWRRVGKTLSRLKLEVFDRNRAIGIYYVYYTASQEGANGDEGFFSSLAFWRDNRSAEEDEYRVKLVEETAVTKIVVLDDADQPQSEGVGLKLLQIIHEKLLTLP